MLATLGLCGLAPENPEALAAAVAGMGCFGLIALVVLVLAILVFVIYCWWRICAKAGFSGAMSLLLLIPGIGGLILILILAFGEWPALKDRP